MHRILSIFLLLLGSAPTSANPPLANEYLVAPSVHKAAFERHRFEPPKERTSDWKRAPRQRAFINNGGPSREVLGYLPYWELDYDSIHWDKLTTLAFFAAKMESDGSPSDLHGWDGPTSAALRDEAHAHGVRYILTVINFSSGEIDALVNDPEARANAVQQLLGAVMAMDADGVNIDFEGVPLSAKLGLTAFVQETADAFHANIPDSQVTVATPAVDWSGAFDYDQLAYLSDGLMIMGYGYHWKGGNPGPLSPVSAGSIWGEKTLTWTIEDYLQWGGQDNHDKFILGLPFYGRDWKSEGPEIPGVAIENGSAVPFRSCKPRAAAAGGFNWDEHSQTTYFMEFKDDAWHQIWCDDGPSWVEKLKLVEQYDLLGIGIWALGYDGSTSDYWDAIEDAFIKEAPPTVPPSEDVGDMGDITEEQADAGASAPDSMEQPSDTTTGVGDDGDTGWSDTTVSSTDVEGIAVPTDPTRRQEDIGTQSATEFRRPGTNILSSQGDAGCSALPFPTVIPNISLLIAALMLCFLISRRQSKR